MRICFLVSAYFFNYQIEAGEVVKILFQGMYMDASMAGYLMLIPLLLFFVKDYIPYSKIIFYYHLIFSGIISILYSADAVLYKEWGYRMDKTAFIYLANFKEAGNFIAFSNVLIGISLIGLYFYVACVLFKKIKIEPSQLQKKSIYLFNLVFLPAMILPIRGGTGIIPMNPGKVYFSTHAISNHAALNVPWNLLYSINKTRKSDHEIQFMESEEADRILKANKSLELTPRPLFISSQRPKILMFILESFTSNLIFREFRGSEITPGLNRYFKTGIYFKNAYASGDRTEMGLAASLSGFPAQPFSSILHYPDKTQRLPSLIPDLKKQGYRTSFYYGGDVSFANMNTFLLNAGCDEILDKNDFPSSSYNAKWGVHDHILFEKVYSEVIADTSRFFKICLSLSSHPPYDVPEPTQWEGISEETQFLNTAYYTDKYLTLFLDKLQKDPVWNELLVVIVADHGARLPGNFEYHTPEKFHIPLWLGGGVVQKDSSIQTVVSQSDLPGIMLNELGLTSEKYLFSNSLGTVKIPFAYYAFNKGYGMVDSCGSASWNLEPHHLLLSHGEPCATEILGKAFVQKVVGSFQKL